MKLITAIIRPEKLEAVQAALNERDVYLMTVSDVRGCGRQRGYTEVYRGTDGELMIFDGVTRATRVAKLLPGRPVRVEVIDDIPTPVSETERHTY